MLYHVFDAFIAVHTIWFNAILRRQLLYYDSTALSSVAHEMHSTFRPELQQPYRQQAVVASGDQHVLLSIRHTCRQSNQALVRHWIVHA